MRSIKENKKCFLFAVFLLFAAIGVAQPSIQGSISKDAAANTVDVWFKPNYTSVAGEYINYFQMSVAIPAAGTAGLTASAVAVNAFQNMGNLIVDGPYIEGPLIVFNFTYLNPAPPSPNNFVWTNGVDFIGVKVTFGGVNNRSLVQLVDFTNVGGGANSNTFFGLLTNTGDKTNYANLFYTKPGLNMTGTDANGDQYVETLALVGLPVSLLDFSGYKDGSRNQLRWSTAGEQDSRGFQIERSSDQVHFESLGFVNSLAPGGNSSSRLNYAYADNFPKGLQQYYRLRMTDLNGTSKYSNVIMLRREKPLTLSVDEIFPNPVQSKINLRINAAVSGSLSVVITDMSGKKLIERKINAEIGYNLFPVTVDNLPAGTYMIHIVGDDGKISKKFVKE